MKIRNRASCDEEVSYDAIKARIARLCETPPWDEPGDVPEDIDIVVIRTIQGIFDGITTSQLDDMSARVCDTLKLMHPGYDALAGRILVSNLHKNAGWLLRPRGGDAGDDHRGITFSSKVAFIQSRLPGTYQDAVVRFVARHAAELDAVVDYTRDFRHDYFSMRTLEKGYLQRVDGVCVESPQDMWLRVAVAVHCPRPREGSEGTKGGEQGERGEGGGESGVLERIRTSYDMMSTGLFTHATPTLFNAGTRYEQLSSCYLCGVDDSLSGIYKTLSDCAQISKWAGGIGVHVSNVRAKGSRIVSTNGSSDGIVPMLKVFNETARYCNQSGRRKGSIAIYLEPWHADVWEFVDLKRNVGAETERARDLFLALWVPDLFMRAVLEGRRWHLMSADACPGLQDVYGDEFDALYERYVAEGRFVRSVDARALWDHIMTCQIETGVPYVLFKDHVNRKCNQKNLGTIRSSNLCAEITEYSDADTYAVCNLASIAVNRFVIPGDGSAPPGYDFAKLHDVAKHITRNLDRIITINYYPTPETRKSNLTARPIGIGIQGLADLFHAVGVVYGSEEALALDAAVMETIYHGALEASVELARAHGPYPGFAGSPFSRGQLQMDLWAAFPGAGTASGPTPTRFSGRWDWDALRADVVRHGTRNSMLTALMPTASTSQIMHNNECFECVHGNIFKRQTLAGEFMVINKTLMKELLRLGLWDEDTRQQIIRDKGSVQRVAAVPQRVKDVHRTVWDVPQRSVIDHAVARGPFVDQSQSMNLFFEVPNSQKLSTALVYAWKKGLKTGMYYHRSLPADAAKTPPLTAAARGPRGTKAGGGGAARKAQLPEKKDETEPVCIMDEGCAMCSA